MVATKIEANDDLDALNALESEEKEFVKARTPPTATRQLLTFA